MTRKSLVRRRVHTENGHVLLEYRSSHAKTRYHSRLVVIRICRRSEERVVVPIVQKNSASFRLESASQKCGEFVAEFAPALRRVQFRSKLIKRLESLDCLGSEGRG